MQDEVKESIIYKTVHGFDFPEINMEDGFKIMDCNLKAELPMLRQHCTDLTEEDARSDTYLKLVAYMINTMYNENGIGIAAPQVGIPKRIIAIDHYWFSLKMRAPLVLINPEIIEESEEKQQSQEACLSVPGLLETIERPQRVKVKAYTFPWEPVEIEEINLGAAALCHEIDHLNGKLFIDYLSRFKQDLYYQKMRKVMKQAKLMAKHMMKTV